MKNKLYLFLCFSLLGTLTRAQTTQTEFGKNRVQYHQEFKEWSMYESRNFITYWYGEARYVGQAVVQIAEFDFNEIQGMLEHRINDKIEIIVYKDLTDLKQSNIGSEEAFENTGGQTKIVGNKMFVYFNGDHKDLRRQIREGIASVYLNAMLFGSNLQEIVQNAVMMNLPAWFKDGLVGFVGEKWNAGLDDQLRDILLSGKYKDFDDIAEDYPKLAGHALWYFISENYGISTVSNLLYLTRINRSLDSGFLYVLGSSYPHVLESWEAFFKKRYEAEVANMREPEGLVKVKNKRNVPLTQLKISPDGTKIAYVANEIGRYKVWIQDVQTGERELVFKNGFRNAIQATDYNYPLLAWNPGGFQLAVIYEERDKIQFLTYDLQTRDKKIEPVPNQFQRWYSAEYINATDLVVSAAVRGQSDLFLYFTLNRQSRRLTNDFWDDLDASFVRVHGQRGILFASNRLDSLNQKMRLDTILPIANYDIFYLNLDDPDAEELVRVTHTPDVDERAPVGLDEKWFAFATNESGVYNRKTGYLEDYIHHFENVITFEDGTEMRLPADSVIAEVLDSAAYTQIKTIVRDTIYKTRAIHHFNSNFDRGLLSQSAALSTRRLATAFRRNGTIQFFVADPDPAAVVEPAYTAFRQQKIEDLTTTETPAPETEVPAQPAPEKPKENYSFQSGFEEPEPDTAKVDVDNYLFQSEFDETEIPLTQTEVTPETDEPNLTIQQQLTWRPEYANNANNKKVHDFRPGRITPYRLKFRTDYVTTQLDNSILFDGLSNYGGVPNDFGYPPAGILFKTNFKDLFEDYEFEAGIRVPTSFNGAEYFVVYKDKKNRFDKQIAFYRRRLRFSNQLLNPLPPTQMRPPTPATDRLEEEIVLGQYQLRYPIDVFRSFRGTTTLRFDNSRQLATDDFAVGQGQRKLQHLGFRLEYVFDNTVDVALNIKNGTRYKVYAEFLKSFDLSFTDGIDLNKGHMFVMGLDARHYQRFWKHSILAIRVAGSSSFGTEKVLYMVGGTDNWLFPKMNTDIPRPDPGNGEFVYQSVATNARGFDMNIRNGNSFALTNIEIRMPIFRYLFRQTQSAFLRNFQLVGFFDAATAWQGLSPFDDESPLNTFVNSNNAVTVRVNFFRDPVVFGYGGGVRTVLFGYFVRLDYARGIETRTLQSPKIHFSIGLDF
ncbi:MAG: hypothetical protein D6714_13050 [Bacteroidetes bacterium]|nr:MAG: hypothetical protein D6714_13050 [Bacteroidota bacterium]